MVEKLFGLLFVIAGLLFAWKFAHMPPERIASKKKGHTIASVGNPGPDPTGEEPTDSETQQPADMVTELKKLIEDQDDLVGLSSNIQRINLKSQLKNKKLNSSISKSLAQVAILNAGAPYRIEADIFDTSDPINDVPKARRKNNHDNLPDQVVFQFSVFDVKSGNKVSEFGATFDVATVAPELAGDHQTKRVPNQVSEDVSAEDSNERSVEDKKKPDETSASSGSK